MPGDLLFSDLVVKLAGNLVLCLALAVYYKRPLSVGTAAGVVRTLIGIAISVLLLYSFHSPSARPFGMVAMLLFAWVRLMAWAAVFWIFFRDPPPGRIFVPIILFAGVIYSGVLDLLTTVVSSARGITIM